MVYLAIGVRAREHLRPSLVAVLDDGRSYIALVCARVRGRCRLRRLASCIIVQSIRIGRVFVVHRHRDEHVGLDVGVARSGRHHHTL